MINSLQLTHYFDNPSFYHWTTLQSEGFWILLMPKITLLGMVLLNKVSTIVYSFIEFERGTSWKIQINEDRDSYWWGEGKRYIIICKENKKNVSIVTVHHLCRYRVRRSESRKGGLVPVGWDNQSCGGGTGALWWQTTMETKTQRV